MAFFRTVAIGIAVLSRLITRIVLAVVLALVWGAISRKRTTAQAEESRQAAERILEDARRLLRVSRSEARAIEKEVSAEPVATA